MLLQSAVRGTKVLKIGSAIIVPVSTTTNNEKESTMKKILIVTLVAFFGLVAPVMSSHSRVAADGVIPCNTSQATLTACRQQGGVFSFKECRCIIAQ